MNYYEHHLGDYAAATAHLSLVEDAVYTRMIRRYYLQEGPLPADVGQVARLVGARDKDALAAVEAVLAEFFTLQADGWHNKRCDEEVARYRDKTGKAKASAAARWAGHSPVMPSDSDRNATAMRTHSEGNAHQTPDTSLHTPESQKQEQKRASPSAPQPKGTRLPADWMPAPEQIAWAKAKRPELDVPAEAECFRDYWHAKPGKDGRKLDWDATFRNWIRNSRQTARAGPTAKPKTVAAYDAIGAKIDELSAVVPGRDRARVTGPDPA